MATAVGAKPEEQLSQRVREVCAIRTDSHDMQVTLQYVSPIVGENSAASRRNLQGELEQKAVQGYVQFLQALKGLSTELNAVKTETSHLAQCCQEMTVRLTEAKDEIKEVADVATRLAQERRKCDKKSKIANAFAAKFRLSRDELEILRVDDGFSDQFFDVLAKLVKIHTACKEYLVHTRHQRIGLEIMDEMAALQDMAFERLFRWVQAELRNLDQDEPDAPLALRKGIAALKERPVLFQSCIEDVGASRKTATIKRFIAALTTGGPRGTARPIEMHAHDPLRYVGDMLSWLHQAVAMERDLLFGLFGTEGVTPEIGGVLDLVFQGVTKPLRSRIEQVLVAQKNILTCFKLANILEFYHGMLSSLLGVESSLCGAVLETKAQARDIFKKILQEYADRMVRFVPEVPLDLAAPQLVFETVYQLSEIMLVHDGSLVGSSSSSSSSSSTLSSSSNPTTESDSGLHAEVNFVVDTLVDALMTSCKYACASLSPTESSVFMINNISTMLGPLVGREYAKVRHESLVAEIAVLNDVLAREQSELLLTTSGMSKVITAIQTRPSGVPAAQCPGLDANAIRDAIQGFYRTLFSAGSLVLPQVDRIVNPKFRRSAYFVISERVMDAYAIVHSLVHDPKSEYEDPSTVASKDPKQIAQLLT